CRRSMGSPPGRAARNDVARSRSGAGKWCGSWFTFNPMPTTAKGIPPLLPTSSSIPAAFRPSTSTSLGHLTPTEAPETKGTTAWTTATDAQATRRGHCSGSRSGRTMREHQMPWPAGDDHARPRRPRPAVCASATTTVPSGAPARASSRARSLVDGSDRWTSTRPSGQGEATPSAQATLTTGRIVPQNDLGADEQGHQGALLVGDPGLAHRGPPPPVYHLRHRGDGPLPHGADQV